MTEYLQIGKWYFAIQVRTFFHSDVTFISHLTVKLLNSIPAVHTITNSNISNFIVLIIFLVFVEQYLLKNNLCKGEIPFRGFGHSEESLP